MIRKMKHRIATTGFRHAVFLVLLMVSSCSKQSDNSWCNHPLRPEFSRLREVRTNSQWFKVYEAGEGVFAIAEPYNFQEVISYLITGKDQNILFDTGMGMASIAAVVRELSDKPVIVINSHTHYDHIGGNHEFENIYSVDTAYTHQNANGGWPHDEVRQEVKPNAFCYERLPSLDTTAYSVKPYADKITRYIRNGDTIDLGGRVIEIIQVPGHTPDGLALLDRNAGYLWTGDNYYEGPIWLFFEGTDLNSFAVTAGKFTDLAPSLTRVFPAHNITATDPKHLLLFKAAFQSIINNTAIEANPSLPSHPQDTIATTFRFEHFSFMIRKDHLRKLRGRE
jgi:glyoxylase-like metal-dependent hydrolase (beta-lactamase superfamily II)